MRATCPAHLILLDVIALIMHNLWSSSLWNFLQTSTTSSLLGPYIPLGTLFSNTLNLRSYLDAKYHVLHPYKTTGKINYLLLRGKPLNRLQDG
jgi:hypothetical protein